MAFYQEEYRQPGLTTEMPSEPGLRELMTSNFRGSQKDFSGVIEILRHLGVPPGAKVLDFGANWGYGVFQLRKAGYDAVGFEVSRKRAQFASRLGVCVRTDLEELERPFDAVYSSHVLEHVPNPTATLKLQLDLVRAGGFVIAHTPNGSDPWRRSNFATFHRHWGRVHPFLLSAEFIGRSFPDVACFVSSDEQSLHEVAAWKPAPGLEEGDLSKPELLIVIRAATLH